MEIRPHNAPLTIPGAETYMIPLPPGGLPPPTYSSTLPQSASTADRLREAKDELNTHVKILTQLGTPASLQASYAQRQLAGQNIDELREAYAKSFYADQMVTILQGVIARHEIELDREAFLARQAARREHVERMKALAEKRKSFLEVVVQLDKEIEEADNLLMSVYSQPFTCLPMTWHSRYYAGIGIAPPGNLGLTMNDMPFTFPPQT